MNRHLRAFTAAVLLCAGMLAITLASAPQLHDRLHKADGTVHECAATLLTTGVYDHSPAPTTVSVPAAEVATPLFSDADLPVIARVEPSILEHAPPARA